MAETVLKALDDSHKLGQDHKRDLDQKHKWALGEGPLTRGQQGKRPAKPYNSGYSKAARREVEFHQNKAIHNMKMARKHDPVFDTDTSASDTSTEEDIRNASTAPEPDVGYTYSFDASRGPGKGSQILGLALAKAVEKFETKATDKLIREEYDVVGIEKEEYCAGYVADADDFELV